MKKTKVPNPRKLRYKIRRKIHLKNPIPDRRNLRVKNRRARGEDEKKNGFVLGIEIIEVTVDLGAAKDGGAMTFSHLRR